MKDWMEALRASAALDDRRDRGAASTGQARVDEALSHPGAASWTPAPAGLQSRVMARVRADRPERASLRLSGPTVALSLAAMIVLALSIGVYLAWPRPVVIPTLAAEGPKAPAFDTRALVQLPAQAGPIALAAMEDPLVEEARRIREDTRRAMAGVFAPLPMRMSR